MKVLIAYAIYQWKRSLRTPITLVWTFVLPMVWLLLFGKMRLCLLDGVAVREDVWLWGRATSLSYTGFLMMGVIELNAVSIGLFGVGGVLVQMRQQGILKRLLLMPQPPWKFVGGQLLASGTIVAASTLLLLTVGGLAFQVCLPYRLFEWCVVLGVGSMTFLTLGCALASMICDVRTIQVVGNIVFFLFMFLGGVWFPLSALPQHLQWLGLALPLSHFLQMLRAVGGEGQPLGMQLFSLIILCLWGGIATLVAGGRFRKIRHFNM